LKKGILVCVFGLFLVISQVSLAGDIGLGVIEIKSGSVPAYTTSGIELLFGGDYADHEVTAWENKDQMWEEDYTLEVYDPGWGLINDIVIADIDGDDMQETLVANSGSMVHIYEHDGEELVLTHNLTHPSWNDQVNTIAVGDLDNDGSPILEVLATAGSQNYHSVVFKRVGDSYSPVFNITSDDPRHAAGSVCTVGDMNNDGDLEFIVSESIPDADGLSLIRLFDWVTDTWVNIRNFALVTDDYNNNVQTLQIADVDNDDENEVLVNQDQEFVIVLEYSGGIFSRSWSCAYLDTRIDCTIAGDITNDGLIDIVVPDPVTDLIYIYETVEEAIVNTFNISFVHDNHWFSGGFTCMDIGELGDDGLNEWVFVHWNETAFPHEWITIFRNDTILQEGPTGFLYGSTVEIGNYDNDEAGIVVTTTSSPTTPTTPTNPSPGGLPIPLELLAIGIAVPIILVIGILGYKRKRI